MLRSKTRFQEDAMPDAAAPADFETFALSEDGPIARIRLQPPGKAQHHDAGLLARIA
jgi:hypothetical protein